LTTQDIKAIKVLSIIATVAVPEETQHKKVSLCQNKLFKTKTYYVFCGHPLHSKSKKS